MDNLQAAWLLLLYCAAPRANYALRTTPPHQVERYAAEHDRRVLETLLQLLQLEGAQDEANLTSRQVQLPQRYGGLGLRSSRRTAPAAYWASLGDCLQPLARRYPAVATQLLELLEGPREAAPPCLAAAQEATEVLDAAGMQDRPSWQALARGVRPREPDPEDTEPGDWQHGWQFEASNALEQQEHNNLLGALRGQELAGPSPGPARLRSCAGRNSSVWLTTCPTSQALRLGNNTLLTALRMRLGEEVPQEEARCEGCHAQLDPRGYHRLSCNRTARFHTGGHTVLLLRG